MEIRCLGTGGALGTKFNTNFLVRDNEADKQSFMAIDCGSTWPQAMRASGLNDLREIESIFISHLHADHAGGLEYLGFSTYFKEGFPFGQHRRSLYGLHDVLSGLWDHTLKGGMESLQGRENTLSTFFHPYPLPPNGNFYHHHLYCEPVQTVHVIDNRRIVPSAGLKITEPNTLTKKPLVYFFTGDIQFSPNQIRSFYEEADFIFQDCELANYPNSVHAQYHELKTLPKTIKKKMWLTHWDGNSSAYPAQQDGFLGFLNDGNILIDGKKIKEKNND